MWQKHTQGQHTAHILLAPPEAPWARPRSQQHGSHFLLLLLNFPNSLLCLHLCCTSKLARGLWLPSVRPPARTEGAYGGGRGQGDWMLALLIFYRIVNQSYWLWSLPIIASSPANYRLQGLYLIWVCVWGGGCGGKRVLSKKRADDKNVILLRAAVKKALQHPISQKATTCHLKGLRYIH